jgi:fermentation-respiration switch protein FrsA (DUF1100 family)
MEYRSYGTYKGNPTEDGINSDAETVFDFLTTEAHLKSTDIIVFGRSMGSGPATHLASIRSPASLLLMSPFKSIRDLVGTLVAKPLQFLIKERFRNIDKIGKVQCPTFIVHGQADRLIHYSHAQDLY